MLKGHSEAQTCKDFSARISYAFLPGRGPVAHQSFKTGLGFLHRAGVCSACPFSNPDSRRLRWNCGGRPSCVAWGRSSAIFVARASLLVTLFGWLRLLGSLNTGRHPGLGPAVTAHAPACGPLVSQLRWRMPTRRCFSRPQAFPLVSVEVVGAGWRGELLASTLKLAYFRPKFRCLWCPEADDLAASVRVVMWQHPPSSRPPSCHRLPHFTVCLASVGTWIYNTFSCH